MKCGDCFLEIPGCGDILFFVDISFEGIGGIISYEGFPHYSSSYISDIPSEGKMTIRYYASDDLSWINDWMDYTYNINSRMSFSALSNVSQAYARRKIKMYYKTCIFTFYDTCPCEIMYNDLTYSREHILPDYSNSNIKVSFYYNWVEKVFI